MATSSSRLLTPLARARGLGSSKHGTDHWWMQRMTSIALVPLGLWFVFSLAALVGADHATVSVWLGSPWTATLMILFIVAGLHHASAGVEVIMEDYIQTKSAKVTAIIVQKFFFTVLAVISIVSVLKIAVGG